MTKEIRTDKKETLKNALKKIEELEKENAEMKALNKKMSERIERLEGYERIVKKLQDNGFDTFMSIKEFCKEKIQLEKENEELRRIAEHQQSSNMESFFEIKKAKEGLAVGSILNRGLIASNKYLEEERDKYRNMVFDLLEENEEAKKIIKEFSDRVYYEGLSERAENFIKE